VRKPDHFELPQDFRKVSVEGSLENGADDASAYSVFTRLKLLYAAAVKSSILINKLLTRTLDQEVGALT